MNAKNFEVIETLKNGVTARIRAIRPFDKAAIVEAFGRLGPESVYTRFFQPKPSLSNAEVKVATEVDFENVVALVVTIECGGREVIIGGGRYAMIDRSNAPPSAELAFLIAEDFRGQGIAGRLLKHLAHIGRGQGVSQFEAEVLAQNHAMLGVFSRSGLPMKQSRGDGDIHLTLSLAGQPEAAGTS